MTTFAHLLDLLRTIPDPRRSQGRMYTLPHLLLFAILAVAAAAIRGHRGVENRSHYVRDVAMAEDASRVCKNPGVLARIRSFAANILRPNGADNSRDARYRLAVGGFDPLRKCGLM